MSIDRFEKPQDNLLPSSLLKTEKATSLESVVTWRSIFIALLLIPPNVFWVVETEFIWHSGHPTTISLFWNVVLNLFFLILINLGIKQVSPKSALTQAEFITIYAMLSIASGLAGHDALALTIPALSHAFWFATPETIGLI